ncbi:hypothetical protein RS9917_12655 [Synechococcus sp. RS9917]|nr:hypothetical protein RS9917_12655 [Synechococcus sp. RS9917]
MSGSPPRRRRLEPQYPPACNQHQTVSLRLPADLLEAEDQAQQALLEALAEPKQRRWSVHWRFEGLRILPVALRFAQALAAQGHAPLLVWPDAGAAALARRDGGALASANASLQDVLAGRMDQRQGDLLITVTPQPSDYDTLEQVCERWTGPVVMLNGRLEDAAVGIGSVARARRRGFVATWQVAYWLEPLAGAALLGRYPASWTLFRQDADGYREVTSFDQRPDVDQIDSALHDGAVALGQQIGAMDRFLKDLSG